MNEGMLAAANIELCAGDIVRRQLLLSKCTLVVDERQRHIKLRGALVRSEREGAVLSQR